MFEAKNSSASIKAVMFHSIRCLVRYASPVLMEIPQVPFWYPS